MATDFGVVAWHEDGHWNLARLEQTRDFGAVIDRLKSLPVNGGALALISIDEDFFMVARLLGTRMQAMISDVVFALDYEVAAELVEILDLPYPEEDDAAQPGGDMDLLADLGISAMELEAICDDEELYPDEQIEAIAGRLGFGENFSEMIEG